jgi:hypothetical protein
MARVGVKSLATCRLRSPPHPNLPPRWGEGVWSITRERCPNGVWPDLGIRSSDVTAPPSDRLAELGSHRVGE